MNRLNRPNATINTAVLTRFILLIVAMSLMMLTTGCSNRTKSSADKPSQTAGKTAVSPSTVLSPKQIKVRYGKDYSQQSKQGQALQYRALKRIIAKQDIVYVAEKHTQYTDHLVQLHLLQMMYRQNPKLAIGVEWFQLPAQAALNQYLSGRINEATFLKKSEYYKRWGYDYRLIRPILQFAKKNNIPMIALNADVDLTRKVSKRGLSSLTKKELTYIPSTLHPPVASYAKKLRRIFKMHARDPAREENFIHVQRIWDQTMANEIVEFKSKYPRHRVIVMAGIGHIESRHGIPGDVDRELSNQSVTIAVSKNPAQDAKNPTDFVITAPHKALPKSGKLGVFIDQSQGMVVISKLKPASAAFKAGLRPKDRILKINNKIINNLADMKIITQAKKPGDSIKISVLRGDRKTRFNTTMKLQ